MEVFLGTILTTAITYAPRGWAPCAGQLLSISQNSALFALLGTTYGGDGVTTFALPDLRGRMVLGMGNGPGLTPRVEGEKAGAESVVGQGNASGAVAIGVANLPAHTHNASSALSATTTLKVGTTGAGVGLPVDGAGLTAATGGPGGASIYASPAPTSGTVNLGNVSTAMGGAVDATGSGVPLPVNLTTSVTTPTMSPYLVLNYIIALEGIFPARN